VERGADCLHGPADATASQNPIISCLIKIQTGFTFLYRLTQSVLEKRHGCSSSSSSSSSSSHDPILTALLRASVLLRATRLTPALRSQSAQN